MVRKILVPLDGSVAAESVIGVMARLCQGTSSEVILARIEEPGPLDPGPSFQEESLALARDYLRDQAATLAGENLKVRVEARSGPIVESLLAIAREDHASLVALATHGRTASASLPFGGVAEQLIRRSPVPILVIPSLTLEAEYRVLRPSDAPARPLLVTTDGSEVSAAVIPAVLEVTQVLGSEVLLLHVVSTSGRRGGHGPTPAPLRPEWLREFARPFRAKGLRVRTLLRKGDPAAVILKESRRQGVGLIAMGTHGCAASTKRAVGSVTEAVLKGASVPLLVTRRVRERVPAGVRRSLPRSSSRQRQGAMAKRRMPSVSRKADRP